MPPEITILAAETDMPIMRSGVEIGTYSVDLDGNVTVQFKPGLALESIVSFDLVIEGQFGDNIGNAEIEFGNDININVTVDDPPEPPAAYLFLSKGNSGYDPVNKTMGFSIDITAYDGPVELDKLTDLMSYIPVVPPPGTAAIPPLSSYVVNITAPNGIQSQITGVTDGFEIEFDGTLPQGATITITYSVPIDQMGLNLDAVPEYDFYIYNGAQVTGKNGESSNGGTYGWAKFKKVQMGKYVTPHTGGATWSGWHVGDGSTPLNGHVITDTLGGLVFDGDQDVVVLYRSLSQGFFTNTLHLADGGTGFAINVPAANATIPGTSTPCGDIVEVWVYNYNTRIANPEAYTNGEYGNSMGIDMEDIPDVDVPVNIIRENLGAIKNAYVGDDYVEWTVEFTIPADYYNVPVWLFDEVTVNGYGVRNIPLDMTINGITGDGQAFTGDDGSFDYFVITRDNYDPNVDGDWNRTNAGGGQWMVDSCWLLYLGMTEDDFYNDPANVRRHVNHKHEEYKYYCYSPWEHGAVLTITYKTPFDAPLVNPPAGGPYTFGEALLAWDGSKAKNMVQATTTSSGKPLTEPDYIRYALRQTHR